jgi:hypothetical protein
MPRAVSNAVSPNKTDACPIKSPIMTGYKTIFEDGFNLLGGQFQLA